jgi:hypothetical protein
VPEKAIRVTPLERQLCEIAGSGGTERGWASDVALVRNPQFVCRKCGRVALEAGFLCDPVKI